MFISANAKGGNAEQIKSFIKANAMASGSDAATGNDILNDPNSVIDGSTDMMVPKTDDKNNGKGKASGSASGSSTGSSSTVLPSKSTSVTTASGRRRRLDGDDNDPWDWAVNATTTFTQDVNKVVPLVGAGGAADNDENDSGIELKWDTKGFDAAVDDYSKVLINGTYQDIVPANDPALNAAMDDPAQDPSKWDGGPDKPSDSGSSTASSGSSASTGGSNNGGGGDGGSSDDGGSKWWLWTLIIILILGAVGGGLYWYFKIHKMDEDDEDMNDETLDHNGVTNTGSSHDMGGNNLGGHGQGDGMHEM